MCSLSFAKSPSSILLRPDHCIVQPHLIAGVFVDAHILQAGIFVAFELVDRIVHQEFLLM